MKKFLLLGAMLGLVVVLTACGSDDSLPSLPGSIVEAPVVTETPIDQNFNWSDLFDEEDNDNFTFDFGDDFVNDDDDFAFDFGDDQDQNQGFLLSLEEELNEMVLEQGIPLEVTNSDLAGLTPANPETVVPIFNPIYDYDEDELPPIEVTAEPMIEVSFEESKELPQTSDPLTLAVIAMAVGIFAVIVYLITKRLDSKPLG